MSDVHLDAGTRYYLMALDLEPAQKPHCEGIAIYIPSRARRGRSRVCTRCITRQRKT